MTIQKHVQLSPDVTAQFLIANIERSLAQLKALAEHKAVIASPVEKWLTVEEAARHCSYGMAKFHDLCSKGVIRSLRPTPNSDPRFLASMLNEDLIRAARGKDK